MVRLGLELGLGLGLGLELGLELGLGLANSTILIASDLYQSAAGEGGG
jgi:hypothetical protein